MWYTSELLISEENVCQNLNFIRSQLGEHVTLSSVVKGNAYGHGIDYYVPVAQRCGVEHFSVFSVDEAYQVYKVVKPGTTIMILGMVDDEALDWVIEHDIEFYVFEMDRLQKAVAKAKSLGKKAIVHIEVETGMNRTGFAEAKMEEVLDYLQQHKDTIRFRGLCTHFAGAESFANYYRVKEQIEVFRSVRRLCEERQQEPEQYHTACSAALLNFPETQMDMVRSGILQYGYWPNKETLVRFMGKKKRKDPLLRAIKWRSKIMSLKEVEAGAYIGYGNTFLTETDMKVAAVPVGYAYGYTRSLSNQGRVLVRGRRMSVIGIVNMNMMMIDVTNLEDVEKGDEVVLIGGQGDLSISVDSFGQLSSQLNYELLTRLPKDIPRRVV